jgi:hypothetical protein
MINYDKLDSKKLSERLSAFTEEISSSWIGNFQRLIAEVGFLEKKLESIQHKVWWKHKDFRRLYHLIDTGKVYNTGEDMAVLTDWEGNTLIVPWRVFMDKYDVVNKNE